MGLLGQQTAPVIAIWGLVDAIWAYEAALAGPRDQPATNRAGRYIEHIRKGVLPAARDLAVVDTLTEYLGQERSLRWFAISAADLTWTPSRTNSLSLSRDLAYFRGSASNCALRRHEHASRPTR